MKLKFNMVPLGSFTRSASMAVLKGKKNSPHIFFVAGVVGVVSSAVLACRGTLRFSQSLDKIQTDIDNVKAIKENENYPVSQYRRDLAYVYRRAGWEVIKNYGPPVALGAVSIAALTGSHMQLTKRNAALAAAYAALHKSYLDYRERVRDRFGPEGEREIYRAIKDEVVADEVGKKEIVRVVDENGRSPYAKCFDEGASRHWQKDRDLNRFFIECQQNWANEQLQAYGFVFLNDVYDRLGFDKTTPGQIVGWLREGPGDGFVDFGMFDPTNVNPNFIGGNDPVTWLDFNVDGPIYNMI